MINTKPLIKFLLWLCMGILICIIGISNVFADTYTSSQFSAQLYDNYGPSLSAVTTDQSNARWQGTIPSMTANSSGAAWGISSPVVLLANHTYSVSLKITGPYGGNIVLSSYNRVGVGTTLANAKTSYQNNSYANENYSRVVDGQTIQYAFTPTTNSSYFIIPFATSSSGSNYTFYLENVVIDDLGNSGVSESTINNSLNSQTNVLNQSITNSQNSIIQNNNDNTQAIIDSNKENFNTCHDSYNLVNIPNLYLTMSNRTYSYYLPKSYSSGIYTFSYILDSNTTQIYLQFLNNSSYVAQTTLTTSGVNTVNIPSEFNRFYIFIDSNAPSTAKGHINNIMFANGTYSTYEPYGEEICTNKLDEQTDAINNVNDSINNDNIDDSGISSAFDNFNNFLDDNSTITQLITLPVTLYTAILNNLNGTCQPFNLGSLYGSDLILPCINISQYLGSALWSMIDIIISGFAIYAISKKMIKVFNNFSSLKEGDVIDD